MELGVPEAISNRLHVPRRFVIAVVATVIAIVLPLFSYAPKGYKWLVNERLNSMYPASEGSKRDCKMT
jgi:hypothetical protein